MGPVLKSLRQIVSEIKKNIKDQGTIVQFVQGKNKNLDKDKTVQKIIEYLQEKMENLNIIENNLVSLVEKCMGEIDSFHLLIEKKN